MFPTRSSAIFVFTLLFTVAPAQAEEDYGAAVGHKLGAGLANMTLGWLEIPKNMVNTANDVNLAVGVTGGLFKGVIHMLGRTLAGTVDVLSAPFPTKPIVSPDFVWQNFDVETHYGPAFKPSSARQSSAPSGPMGY